MGRKYCDKEKLLMFSKDFNCRLIKPGLVLERVNSLPNDKIFDCSKLKAFADQKINVTEKLKFVLGRVENNVGKGENAGYQHFLPFPPCFQKP